MKDSPIPPEIKINEADWEATPLSIRRLVQYLLEENQSLKARLAILEEQVRQNSQNSSRPPSGDGFGQNQEKPSPKSKRQRGGQKGHPGHERQRYEASQCTTIEEHKPSSCQHCGEALSGRDEKPYRHQVVEIEPVRPWIEEHQLHQLSCPHCGKKTRATLPARVSASGYGERLSALVAWLSSDYRLSHSQLKSLLERVFGVTMSRASINHLRQEMSGALEPLVGEARQYLQGQPKVHSDETSFCQGNSDGQNPQQKQGWLWALISQWVSVFEVSLSRSQAIAQHTIGQFYKGIVISDRYSSYNWLPIEQRQVCWAHLKRDFTAIAQRSGVSHEIGQALLQYQRRLFRWWHRVRDGTLSREQFQALVERLRKRVKAELEAAAQLPIAYREKTPLAKTVRTCQQILKLEPALWTFVWRDGVEPTNNAAEQALRPAVIWRRTSFGSQSLEGSQFVARLLSVVTSLKSQGRDIWDFLTLVFRAYRFDLPMPSLIPSLP